MSITARSTCFVLVLAALAMAAVWVLPVQMVHAAPPSIEIVSPMPDSIQLQNTSVLLEVGFTGGDVGHDYRIEWDNPQSACSLVTRQVNDIAAFPAYYSQNPAAYSGMRANVAVSTPCFVATGQRYSVRVRVTDLDDPTQTASSTTSIFLLASGLDEGIIFSGYTWVGASTGACSGGSVPGTSCITDSDCVGGGLCVPQSDPLGWASFSCTNLNTTCVAHPTYNVRFTKAPGATPYGTLRQNAWMGEEEPTTAGSVGWFTWNKAYCAGGANSGNACVVGDDCPGGSCELTGNPPAGDPENWPAYQELSHAYSSFEDNVFGTTDRYPSQLAGWGRFLTLKDYATRPVEEGGLGLGASNDWGWLRLRGDEVPKPHSNISAPAKAYHQCSDCSAGDMKCNICDRVQVDTDDTSADWRQYSCNSCYECDSGGNCTACDVCNTYGVSYNSQLATLTGYGWSNASTEGGLGWVQFDPLHGGVGILQSWLATRYGDIFVSKSNTEGESIIVNTPLPAPPGSFNATYIIQANGTIAFTSASGYIQPGYPSEILLPAPGNQYINVLGRIDFAGMTRVGSNRYGTTEIVNGTEINAWGSSKVLDGNIYWAQEDITIATPITFQPGTGDQSGAGTIIVDGNLTIAAPVTYNNSPIGSLINLPSVSWIVRGDVIIDPTVGTSVLDPDPTPDPNLVGAFIVLGCPGGFVSPCGPAAREGSISTGESETLELIVNGLMMGKKFNFERTVSTQRGSEQVIYDGRLIANPPPGLNDLSAALPVIREVTP